jgi:GLPGLI family protein
MQKFLLAALLLPALQIAQVQAQAPAGQPAAGPSALKEGKIIYEKKVNLHRRLTDESMKTMVPEFNTSKSELDFSADESIYKNIKEDEDIRDKAGQENNGNLVMRFGGGADDQTYKNYTTERTTQQKELGPKKYLIEDSLKKQNWKLEEGTKAIKGYTCKKATTKGRDGSGIIAWYAEDIQSSTGPEIFGGLPGLILELNLNDAEILFTTLDIVTKDFDKKIVAAPTNGKKITRKEFDKMMEDQFGVKPGGGTTIRIIRN